jgi:apolipoprotein N-acyltransferase
VLRRLGLGQAGIIDSQLPKALATPPPYARFGDIGIGLLLTVAAIFLALVKLRQHLAER